MSSSATDISKLSPSTLHGIADKSVSCSPSIPNPRSTGPISVPSSRTSSLHTCPSTTLQSQASRPQMENFRDKILPHASSRQIPCILCIVGYLCPQRTATTKRLLSPPAHSTIANSNLLCPLLRFRPLPLIAVTHGLHHLHV